MATTKMVLRNTPKLIFSFLMFLMPLGTAAQAQVQQAQQARPEMKFGKVSDAELQMKVYEPDKDASAVVLCSNTTLWYTISQDLQLSREVFVRLKVLKAEGKNVANVEIPYMENEVSRQNRETIEGLKAMVYNIENGKVVKVKMESDMVHRERIDKDHMLLKFTVPQVKVGSVIEYQYVLQSDYFYKIDPWYAQKKIPVAYTFCTMTIPEYFKFHVEQTGAQKVEAHTTPVNVTFRTSAGDWTCNGEEWTFEGFNLPAITKDDFLWCPQEYASRVTLELSSIQLPGSLTRNFTESWNDISKQLLEDEDFGKYIKRNTPLENVSGPITLHPDSGARQITSTIYQNLKRQFKWNGEYKLWGEKTSKVLNDRTGSNADLNFLLMNSLRDAGLKAYPVVMSSRDQGPLPYTHPSSESLNTFVVGVAENDSTLFYIDSSVEDGYINVLPPKLKTDRARVIYSKDKSDWVNLQNIDNSMRKTTIDLSVSPTDKALHGTVTSMLHDNEAADLRHDFRTEKDSATFVNTLADKNGLTISNYRIADRQKFTPNVTETYNFTKPIEQNGDLIYVNPITIPLFREMPFTAETRTMPIEFRYKVYINQSVNIQIPKGYTVQDLPKGVRMVNPDRSILFTFTSGVMGDHIVLNYRLNVKRTLFTMDEYPIIRQIFDTMTQRNNDVVVLKKGE
jgi:hypothetical protein